MYVVLTFTHGPQEGANIVVARGAQFTVGRSSKSSRKIRDSHLSRVHVQIDFLSGDRAVVRDLNSRTGTFVNGRRIREHPLQNHDRVVAGEQGWDVLYVRDLSELADEGEETISFLDEPKACVSCGRSISLATFAEGDVPERGGEYLCPDCSVVVSFDDHEFEGFEIIERLGSGSAGMVFRARQKVLDRIVALKVFRRRQSHAERREARFLQEAAVISRLDHPHIVKIFDASGFAAGYYLVMEYFEAMDLLSLIEKRGLPSVPVALSIGLQMCSALEYAASEGVVHRDVKPANILYHAGSGVAKLTDFGLAKRMGVSAGTRDGEGVGTPCYMPPEQVNNARNVDHRADIYSLGASLYHMLTGRYPVVAKNLQEFVKGILERDPPPIEQYNPKAPTELCEVIRRAMSKKPRARFQSATAMHESLERVRVQFGIPDPPRIG